MADFWVIEMRNRLISIRTLFFIANAAKEKKSKSLAPHLYQQKVFNSGAAEGKREKGRASVLFPLDKTARCDYIDFINAMSET